MERRTLLKQLGLTISGLSLAGRSQAAPFFAPSATDEKIQKGKFEPTWESLQTYQVPDWYRNAKFGIWAHWGPQCQPEAGDWYARGMYEEGSRQYKIHQEKYGHPSKFGFKDVINEWKADQWNPDELVSLYKGVGAKYFFAMANHHDNLDLYNSKYQKNWNSTKVGPKKDIIGGWAKAAKKQGLPFGVSVHAAHAWRWFETAQRSDKNGPLAGVPYDGNLTKADGKGLWWEGLDPQELYAQRHPLSQNSADNGSIHGQWHWGNGVYPPTKAYMENFVNRTIDLINQYDPDLIYFDDSQLPFWPISDAGIRIAAHHYNHSIKKHGELRAILNGKILDENQRKAMVWDIERGQANDVLPFVWQSDTCIGDWHYNRAVYDRKGYKTPQMVVQTLVDVVSKNGNYLLNIPVRGNGSIDEQERAIVESIGRWMNANSESIYDTRPWTVYGEGPSTENQAKLTGQGFNEGKTKFTAADIRFNTKGDVLYATVMNAPTDGKTTIKSLAQGSANYSRTVNKVEWLSQKQSLPFERTAAGLVVQFPPNRPADSFVDVLKIV
ncbi:alpha-L-fucosidase [Spirosoma oryzae]|uniref:alpha-L-fucosidase n=1 Tax=Spirosoma oryzae TaxID=1469603 RepID=A0A2T0TF58_9BACT|nr:alpha-L-fucosidase [Spirosoma oryzae]PRY44307.1 alpha-L-fucosidase [Spirosoma oryzae]